MPGLRPNDVHPQSTQRGERLRDVIAHVLTLARDDVSQVVVPQRAWFDAHLGAAAWARSAIRSSRTTGSLATIRFERASPPWSAADGLPPAIASLLRQAGMRRW